MPTILNYLKPEYVDLSFTRYIAEKFKNTKPNCRMVLRVPVEHGDMVTEFLRHAVKPEYRFHRRTGGKRSDGMALTCLRKDATFFKFYVDKRNDNIT